MSLFGDVIPQEPDEACGWFGKLACMGDFGSRRLPADFIQRCDDWLSHCIAASQAQLGADWLNTYLTAPIWRFAWSPGIAGPQWWMGVLMPSVDRVGRYFPLIIAQPCAKPPVSVGDHVALQRWFDHLTQAAMSTLQPDASVESFEAQLLAAPRLGRGQSIDLLAERQLPGRDRYDARGPVALPDWLAGVGMQMFLQALHGRSLWWALPTGASSGSMSLANGLPVPEQFAELLDGSW